MPEQYAGLDTWSPLIALTSDDDVRDASSYAAAGVGLADRTVYLKNRGFYSTPAFGTDPYTNSGTYRIAGQIVFINTDGNLIEIATPRTYARSAIPMVRYFDPLVWEPYAFGVSSNMSGYRQIDSTSQSELVFVFDLPSACILKRAAVTLYPATSHVGVPSVRPRLELWAHSIRTGVGALIASEEDPSAVYSEYNAPHEISMTFSDVIYSPNLYVISARVRGESVTDALPNLNALIPRIEYTRATAGEEFGEFLP